MNASVKGNRWFFFAFMFCATMGAFYLVLFMLLLVLGCRRHPGMWRTRSPEVGPGGMAVAPDLPEAEGGTEPVRAQKVHRESPGALHGDTTGGALSEIDRFVERVAACFQARRKTGGA